MPAVDGQVVDPDIGAGDLADQGERPPDADDPPGLGTRTSNPDGELPVDPERTSNILADRHRGWPSSHE